MAIHILTRAEQLSSTPVAVGDYLIHHQRCAIDLPWRVALVTGPYAHTHDVLATFATKSLALTSVLSHESTGWEDDGVVRHAARAVLRETGGKRRQRAIDRLANALEATEHQKPRVIAVTEHGVTRIHSSHGVDAVAINLNTAREFAREDIQPISDIFRDLLDQADIAWPTSAKGRRREPEWLHLPTQPRTPLTVVSQTS
jgi:hypothetical protein